MAVLSDLIALDTPVPYPEGAFTAGLLHDVGKLLIAIAMPAEFEAMCECYQSGGDSAGDCEMDIVGATHAEISGAILEKWKLPEPIQKAVAYHHTPEVAGRGTFHLAHVIQAADQYLNAAGLGMPPYRHHPVACFDDCHPGFGLQDSILKLEETFKAEFEAVGAFF